MTEQIVLYPLTIRMSDDSNSTKSSIQGIVNNQTDKEWNKLISELKKCLKDYESIYGITGYDVERFKKKFVRLKIKIINPKLYKKWEEKYNLSGVVTSFINHDLNAGGYPSFYKDGYLENKYTYYINKFVLIEVKNIK